MDRTNRNCVNFKRSWHFQACRTMNSTSGAINSQYFGDQNKVWSTRILNHQAFFKLWIMTHFIKYGSYDIDHFTCKIFETYNMKYLMQIYIMPYKFFLYIDSKIEKIKKQLFSSLLMFYTCIFLFFNRDEINRDVFYIFIF